MTWVEAGNAILTIVMTTAGSVYFGVGFGMAVVGEGNRSKLLGLRYHFNPFRFVAIFLSWPLIVWLDHRDAK